MTAYLILAFKNPPQLARLVNSIYSDNSEIYIHIDKKVDIRPFLFIKKSPRIHFVTNRFTIVWGGYSITECIISGMKEIINTKFDHVVLMSGQDYPVRSMVEFEELLSSNKDISFMSVEENSKKSKWWNVARHRYENYYLSDLRFRGKRYLHKLLRTVLPKREFLYPHYRLYGGAGSTFCVLSKESARYIIEFMEGNKRAARFARSTFASDEFWFQTILMNSYLKGKVINTPLWYMDWDGSSKHPRVLTIMDYNKIIDSGFYFARKFDILKDDLILDKLDVILSQKAILHA